MRQFETLNHLPASSQKEILRHLLAETYKRSLFKTARHLLGYSQMTWETHGPICQALEAQSTRKLIVVPRGAFKSSICSISYPIWLLLNNPNSRIMIDSELYSNSTTYLRAIKQHLESERVVELFGRFRNESVWNESEIIIAQRTAPTKEPSITCGGIGTTRVGMHYDYIIGDDYNSPKNSSTLEGCQKIVAHYRYNLSILDPGGTYAIVGTRYSAGDLIGWILENELGMDQFNLKGINNGTRPDRI